MKVKSIFLSMLAIAALASCSKEETNVDPPVPQGKARVIDLTIGSDSLSSKATGAATAATDKAINDLTVFGVNATSGAIITKKYFDTLDDAGSGKKKVNFETTDQTAEIYVVANIGEDLTVAGKALNVSNVKGLKSAQASLIVTPANTPAQTEGKVLMSGSTTTITGDIGGNNPATASVELKFIASKIILKSLKRDALSTGTYGTDFQLQNAYLTHVQTSAYYFMDNNSFIGAIASEVRPAITGTFATGRNGVDSETEVADFKEGLTSKVTSFAPGDAATEDIAYWYVFENSATAMPTTLLIQYVWKETATGAMDKVMYFPVTFITDDASKIEPGKAYNVSLTFHGNFKPTDQGGGGGGGGTEDPDTPIVPGSVDVTVTPADWTSSDVEKPFGK